MRSFLIFYNLFLKHKAPEYFVICCQIFKILDGHEQPKQKEKKNKKRQKKNSQNKRKSKRKTILNYIKKLSLFSELFFPSLVPFHAFFVLKVRGITASTLSRRHWIILASHADVVRGSSRVLSTST